MRRFAVLALMAIAQTCLPTLAHASNHAQVTCPAGGYGVGGYGPAEALLCSSTATEGSASMTGSAWISGQDMSFTSTATLVLGSAEVPDYVPGVGIWLQEDLAFSARTLSPGEMVLRVTGTILTDGPSITAHDALVVSFSFGDATWPRQSINASFDLLADTAALQLNEGRSNWSSGAQITVNSARADAVDIELRLPHLVSSFDNGQVQTVSSTLSLHPLVGGLGSQHMNFSGALTSTFAPGVSITAASGRALMSAVPEPQAALPWLIGLAAIGLARRSLRQRNQNV